MIFMVIVFCIFIFRLILNTPYQHLKIMVSYFGKGRFIGGKSEINVANYLFSCIFFFFLKMFLVVSLSLI